MGFVYTTCLTKLVFIAGGYSIRWKEWELVGYIVIVIVLNRKPRKKLDKKKYLIPIDICKPSMITQLVFSHNDIF